MLLPHRLLKPSTTFSDCTGLLRLTDLHFLICLLQVPILVALGPSVSLESIPTGKCLTTLLARERLATFVNLQMSRQIVDASKGSVTLATSVWINVPTTDEIGLDVRFAMKAKVVEMLEPVATLLALVFLVTAWKAQVDGRREVGVTLGTR